MCLLILCRHVDNRNTTKKVDAIAIFKLSVVMRKTVRLFQTVLKSKKSEAEFQPEPLSAILVYLHCLIESNASK